METNGKSLILQRTLGAALLVAAAATLIPLALDGDGIKAGREQVQIPDEPTFEMQLDDHERVRIHMLQAKGAIQRAEQESAAAAAAGDTANAQAGTGGQGGDPAVPSDPKAPPVGTPAKPSAVAGNASLPPTAGSQEKSLTLPTEPTAAGTRKMEDLVQKLSQPGVTGTSLSKESAAPSLAPDVAEAWTIQMGAFKDRVNADKIVAQLVAHGYRAYLGTQSPGVYRVFVGPEVRRERADQLRDRVAADTGNKGVVVRYLP